MRVGEKGRVVGLLGCYRVVKKLEAIGIRENTTVTKLSSIFSRGPVVVKVNGFQVAVGYGQAKRILVEVD